MSLLLVYLHVSADMERCSYMIGKASSPSADMSSYSAFLIIRICTKEFNPAKMLSHS